MNHQRDGGGKPPGRPQGIQFSPNPFPIVFSRDWPLHMEYRELPGFHPAQEKRPVF
jgi:hypothetical protein